MLRSFARHDVRNLAMSSCAAVVFILTAVLSDAQAQQQPQDLTVETQKAVAKLVEALKSENGEVRRRAMQSFQYDPVVKPETENPAIRSAVPVLIPALKDENWSVRFSAVWALRKTGSVSREVVEALSERVRDTDLNTAVAAATGLKLMGPPAAPAVPALIQSLKERNEDGTFAVPGLPEIRANRSSGGALRRAVIEALGNVGPAAKEALPELRKRLDDQGVSGMGNRAFSAKAIWQITGKADESLPVLIAALEKDQSAYAAEILGTMGPDAKSAAPALRKALESEISSTRLHAAVALPKVDAKEELRLSVITEILQDKNLGMRFYACEALWNLTGNPSQVVPTLITMLNEGKQGTVPVSLVIRLLGEIGPPAKAAVPAIKDILIRQPSSVSDAEVQKALSRIER
ncbi:MAG: HEAT repeat-containing protein [Limisphaerales bacterium]|nr:MAG: HEAT repeat-containing protein [Limisphaerales bacterium]TXT50084.1 MAG: HEAT repeat-containing protein [Limisphaerales bacterium]